MFPVSPFITTIDHHHHRRPRLAPYAATVARHRRPMPPTAATTLRHQPPPPPLTNTTYCRCRHPPLPPPPPLTADTLTTATTNDTHRHSPATMTIVSTHYRHPPLILFFHLFVPTK
ncbi:verprolin-like [Helianthus annuus]|uniref:verprolin-like n=1 Tax=Helianthus annuus TaxID=4232 RepID=UPI000B908614|nr:verprolin-like [Helianthus annuus]